MLEIIANDIQRSRYNHAIKGENQKEKGSHGGHEVFGGYGRGACGRVGVDEASRFASGGALLATPGGPTGRIASSLDWNSNRRKQR